MRSAGGKSWLLSTGVLLGGLLILAVATRRHAPHGLPALQANAVSGSPSSSNPAKTPSGPHESKGGDSGGLCLYDPSDDGADPNWGQPAKLDETKLRDLARSLKELQQLYAHAHNGAVAFNTNLGNLNALRGVLLNRISGEGLKDEKIPALWGRVMGGEYVPAPVSGAAELLAGMAQGAFEIRMTAVESNILAGSTTVGDTLFVDAATRYFRLPNSALIEAMRGGRP